MFYHTPCACCHVFVIYRFKWSHRLQNVICLRPASTSPLGDSKWLMRPTIYEMTACVSYLLWHHPQAPRQASEETAFSTTRPISSHFQNSLQAEIATDVPSVVSDNTFLEIRKARSVFIHFNEECRGAQTALMCLILALICASTDPRSGCAQSGPWLPIRINHSRTEQLNASSAAELPCAA